MALGLKGADVDSVFLLLFPTFQGVVAQGVLGVEVEETAVAEYESVELLLALDVDLSGAGLDAPAEGKLALPEPVRVLPDSEDRTLTGLRRRGGRVWWSPLCRNCYVSVSPCLT